MKTSQEIIDFVRFRLELIQDNVTANHGFESPTDMHARIALESVLVFATGDVG